MTIDTNTIEWIRSNLDPSQYDSYQDFYNSVLNNFDGRYVFSKGFRPAIKELWQEERSGFIIKLINSIDDSDLQLQLAQYFNDQL